MVDFDAAFTVLTGNAPFPWQQALYERFAAGDFPASCNLPTGLGKTNVIAVWLIALANHPDRVPRRLVYVVNRRTVVDQTTDVAEDMRRRLIDEKHPAYPAAQRILDRLSALCNHAEPLAISTLRGQFADNREWSADPSRPAIICGTVDMIGSRLLFGGYGLGFKSRPLHAGFLGQDVLLVHDEAHLEPAFQDLLVAIQKEQERCKEFCKFHVVELSATSRGGGTPFGLTETEKEPPTIVPEPTEPIHHVWRRLTARKGVKFHGARRDAVAKTIGETARDRWKNSGKAVLVFVRTVKDVKAVRDILTDKKHGVPTERVEVLTGTLRGKERDVLVEKSTFRRFLPGAATADETVYLVCTSAGEVGVDISADHLVSDLTPLDSMAQRFGRVNRRGGSPAEVDVVYETDPDPKQADKPFEKARWATKRHLEGLAPGEWTDDRHEASPQQVGKLLRELPAAERATAFAPEPTILPVSDILFDAWALTTVWGKLPGRPHVEPYLHGVGGWQPPETTIAWRDEVELLGTDELLAAYDPEELLEDYPLKPHETLRVPTTGAVEELEKLAKRMPQMRAWLVDDDGTVAVRPLDELADADVIARKTVVLPPAAGGLAGGMLSGGSEMADDVADDWFEDKARTLRRRERYHSENHRPKSMVGKRLIRTIDLKPEVEDVDTPVEGGRYWHWYEVTRGGDGDGSKAAQKPVSLAVHVADVVRHAERIVGNLPLAPGIKAAVVLAAHLHDLGKNRQAFQSVLGNPYRKQPLLAKSGEKGGRVKERFRHEYGSLADLFHAVAHEKRAEFDALSPDMQELCLHLIAAHHGRGRPHFPPDEAFDPDHSDTATVAAEVPRRFARLQRKYGRWGLAYLESLLRAADYAASGAPSEYLSEAGE